MNRIPKWISLLAAVAVATTVVLAFAPDSRGASTQSEDALAAAPAEPARSPGSTKTGERTSQSPLGPARDGLGPAEISGSRGPKPPARNGAAVTPGKLRYEESSKAAALDHLNWAVMVYKSRHLLKVYYKGRLFKQYHAVFGRNPDGREKLWEGDRRTPEGVYSIVAKRKSQRFVRFLQLNYPNVVDRRRYRKMRVAGALPVRAGRVVGEGGLIGIHGTDEPLLNDANVDWTTGCISIHNQDVRELDRLLPLRTVVVIKP